MSPRLRGVMPIRGCAGIVVESLGKTEFRMLSSPISLPLVRYVLMAALRDRLLLSLILLALVGAALSIFLGSSALIEYEQFGMVFAAGGLRFAGVAGLVLFIAFHMRRSFDSKDVEFLLSRPIGRNAFIFSHAFAFSILAGVVAAAVSLAVMAVNPGGIGTGHFLWIFSIVIEFIIMANAALFFSMVVTSAAGSALAVFGLYVLARLMGQLIGIASIGLGGFALPFLQSTMNIIAMVVPRLDLMGQTSWLVYPDSAGDVGFGFMLVQGVLYSALLICAALVDLRRRQF
jgi:hypothetical protein